MDVAVRTDCIGAGQVTTVYFARAEESGKMKQKYFRWRPSPPFYSVCAKYTAVKRDWLVELRIKALISGMSQ